MALGCLCLKCCQVFGAKNDDDDDDEDDDADEDDNLRKYRRDSIFPLDHQDSVYPRDRPKPKVFNKRIGMEFWPQQYKDEPKTVLSFI